MVSECSGYFARKAVVLLRTEESLLEWENLPLSIDGSNKK